MSDHQNWNKANPHVAHFNGSTDSTDSVTGESIRKIATTLANARLIDYYFETDEPLLFCEMYNNSTSESVRVSIDGGDTWYTLAPGQSYSIDPENTSDEPGKGYYCITKIMIIATAVTAKFDIIYGISSGRK